MAEKPKHLRARCFHPSCSRWGDIIVGINDEPNLLKQTHDCCGRHPNCGRADA